MATSKNVEQFTKRFIDFLIIDWEPNLNNPTPMEQIEIVKKDLLEEFAITGFSEQNEKSMKELIEKIYPKFLKDNELENAHDLVNALILGKAEITEQEQIKYLDLVKEFQKTQRIENLYYFGDILSEDTSFKAENALKEIIQEMNNKNKAELLANISVYLEHIKETKDGQAFINQLNTQDPHEWYNELFDRMHKSSPLAPSFDYFLEERKIKHQTQTSGLFDGLYYSLGEDKKTGQLQISATSSVDSSWEGDSVLRHALANAIVNNALEYFFIQEAKTELGLGAESHMAFYEEKVKEKALDLIRNRLLVKNFTPHNENNKNSNRNTHMAETIQNAVNQYLGKNFKSFDEMIKNLTAMPSYYIQEKIKQNNPDVEVTENDEIGKNALQSFVEGNTLFSNESYFVNYSPSSVSLNQGIKETTLWNTVIGDKENPDLLTPEEFKAKAQYMALITHNVGKGYLEPKAVEYFFEQHINLRALNKRNKINNSRLENDKEFEKIIVEHFMLKNPKNISKNIDLLDRNTSKNIESYIKHYLQGIDEKNYRSRLKSSGIDYEGDYADLIKNMTGKIFYNRDLIYQIGQENKRMGLEKEKLINKGLRRLGSDAEMFDGFVKKFNINEMDVFSIKRLNELGFDGEDKEATIEEINNIKNEFRKYVDDVDYSDAEYYVNGYRKNDTKEKNKKVSSLGFKNK